MRTRQEIEKNQDVDRQYQRENQNVNVNGIDSILEILLDIRDLLSN